MLDVRADPAVQVLIHTSPVNQELSRLPPLERPQLGRLIRLRAPELLLDDSGGPPAAGNGFAIYTLSDPRDVLEVRYVGQTRTPSRRLLQHIHTARLWLPDEVPWWFGAPKLRPLYEWIRSLHRDGYRLPAMRITAWAGSVQAARLAERELILQHLGRGRVLFNVEREILDRQVPLL